jgi:hypothetical protein
MVPHAAWSARDDMVLVIDEAVVAALAAGRITAREVRAQGLFKAHGTRESVDRQATTARLTSMAAHGEEPLVVIDRSAAPRHPCRGVGGLLPTTGVLRASGAYRS